MEKEDGKIPIRFVLYDLMIEWGLTPEQFNKVDYSTISEIIEWRQAKAIAQNYKNNKK